MPKLRIETDADGKVHVYTPDGNELEGVQSALWDYADGQHAISLVLSPAAYDLRITSELENIEHD